LFCSWKIGNSKTLSRLIEKEDFVTILEKNIEKTLQLSIPLFFIQTKVKGTSFYQL